ERPNIREPGTGYFYRTMMAKLYRQGMAVQEWDFGNARKYSRDLIGDSRNHSLALCNVPNDPNFQINIPISEVFWDPPSFPIPPMYAPEIPANIISNNFIIDLYRIQRIALKAEM
ncbi:9316_t:CDS:2, partial [Acaulospora morrowiae]